MTLILAEHRMSTTGEILVKLWLTMSLLVEMVGCNMLVGSWTPTAKRFKV